MPDSQYSSQGFSLTLETEITETEPEAIQRKLHDTFTTVKGCVEAELAGGNGVKSGQGQLEDDDPFTRNRRGGDRSNLRATNKQIAYLGALANELGIPLADINKRAGELYGVTSLYELKRSDATKLIDSLKSHAFKAA